MVGLTRVDFCRRLPEPATSIRRGAEFKTLKMREDLARREIIFKLDGRTFITETTPKGPVLFDSYGSEHTAAREQLTVAIYTPPVFFITTKLRADLKRTAACASTEGSEFQAFSLGFRELFGSNVWPFGICRDPVIHCNQNGMKYFLVLTTDNNLRAFISEKKKQGHRIRFEAPPELISGGGELMYLGSKEQKPRAGLRDEFRIGDVSIYIVTEPNLRGEMVTAITAWHYGYSPLGHDVQISRNEDPREAGDAHLRLVRKIIARGLEFLNELVLWHS